MPRAFSALLAALLLLAFAAPAWARPCRAWRAWRWSGACSCPTPVAIDPYAWRPLFNGRTLAGWRVADENYFDRHGPVRVVNGALRLDAGQPGSGIVLAGQPPRMNYELELEARRMEGRDFFCGLTFPVGDAYCTWILGGWGGGSTGLSNVNGISADENETNGYLDVENGRWYRLRLRVTAGRIRCWIDDQPTIDLSTADRRFDIWYEQEPLRPLGLATWLTQAEYRAVRIRTLRPAER